MVSILTPDIRERVEYSKLLETLNNIEFTPSIDMDYNRAKDGMSLRYRFANENNLDDETISYCITGPCSMLEMMCALSLRMEETIMTDPNIGDRTPFWFGTMLSSMGFLEQNNNNFDITYIMSKIKLFNERKYCRNGQGGLFTIKDSKVDLRKMEIWYQMNRYIQEIDSQENNYNYV